MRRSRLFVETLGEAGSIGNNAGMERMCEFGYSIGEASINP